MQSICKIMKKSSYTVLVTLLPLTVHAQMCKPNIKQTRPDSRYEILGNGSEVKDKVTGLIWQRCSVGQTWNGTTCTGIAIAQSWQYALTAAKNLGNGYRLPNIKELQSLTETKCYYPAINSTIFPNTQNSYWSGSLYIYNNTAWSVSFDVGNSIYSEKYYSFYIRAVRLAP